MTAACVSNRPTFWVPRPAALCSRSDGPATAGYAGDQRQDQRATHGKGTPDTDQCDASTATSGAAVWIVFINPTTQTHPQIRAADAIVLHRGGQPTGDVGVHRTRFLCVTRLSTRTCSSSSERPPPNAQML
jgi:hypothetical protein